MVEILKLRSSRAGICTEVFRLIQLVNVLPLSGDDVDTDEEEKERELAKLRQRRKADEKLARLAWVEA